MKLNFTGEMQELIAGIELLSKELDFVISPEGINIRVEKLDYPIVEAVITAHDAYIRYQTKPHFFRALGIFIEELRIKNEFAVVETPQFDTNGIMIDVSQSNAVLKVESVKNILLRMAVMGLNMFMLYTEDSYEIKDEPFFGYMRGKYTYDDLKECDDFADIFGIEMIPCMQTLAHLTDVLKYDRFYHMKDNNECLLVGSEEAYEFIEKMIAAASAPFRSKRIHIGMDEAAQLGLGKYLGLNGLHKKSDIMRNHIARVTEITDRYGLKPMIWSDMHFAAFSKASWEYNINSEISQEYINTIPQNLQNVYWDYYRHDTNYYADMIKIHKKFGSTPIFAGGIWNWMGYGLNYGKTFDTTNHAMEACKSENVREVFATLWGDGGTECNIFSALLGIQLYAEHGYAERLDIEKLKRRFNFCTGCEYDDFVKMKYVDEIPGTEPGNFKTANPSEYLMWQDVLMGMFDKNIEGLPISQHYSDLAADMRNSRDRNGKYGFVFEFLERVCEALAVKSELGLKISNVYKNNDVDGLKRMVSHELPEARKEIERLKRHHREIWMKTYKAPGWEILDLRYGAVIARIDTAISRITDYIEGRIDCVEELDQEKQFYMGWKGIPMCYFYFLMPSASRITDPPVNML